MISLNQEEKPLKIWLQNLPDSFCEKVEILQMNLFLMVNILINVTKIELGEAYQHYKEESGREKPYEKLRFLIFHLLMHSTERLFTEIFGLENGMNATTSEDIKAIAQTDEYKNLVAEKIEITQRASSEIGNMYTLLFLWRYFLLSKFLMKMGRFRKEKK